MLWRGIFFVVFATFVYSLPVEYELPELKEGGVHWALLVAGSNSWFNYRHQADVCHAYHVMKNHGIPDERIVVMMVDDIAHNKLNPTPGIIINEPGGKDVYDGVPKDYTGLKNINPEVFLAVLKGDEAKLREIEQQENRKIGSGKVIKSGPNDNIFVNFVDHGAPGLVAFGSKFLHAKDLNKALSEMHEQKKYNKMVLYIEACESGSMFNHTLKKDMNILAFTASNSTTSSYACYFDKKRKTYLGDLFSVNWMQDSDKENLNAETLEKQFHKVKKATNRSTVCEFGDMKMNTLMVSQFQGDKNSERFVQQVPDPNVDAVPSEDVEIEIYRQEYSMANSKEEQDRATQKILDVQMKRNRMERTMKSIVSILVNNVRDQYDALRAHNELYSFDCYMPVVEHLKNTCKHLELPFDGYALKLLKVMVNLCQGQNAFSADAIIEAINKSCL